jgi:RNA polymerase sigma-70 factor (ECF subfamily)
MTTSAHSPLAFAQGGDAAHAEAKGEAAAMPTFGEIYATHFRFVWKMTRRLGVPEASLDDVVQEVFIVVYRRFADRPREVAVEAWLYGILLNVTRRFRRVARRASVEIPRSGTDRDVDRTTAHPGLPPDESVARSEALEALEIILRTLDEEKLEVFVLAELEQLSMPRIAKLLGINLFTAYARLRAAHKVMQEAILRHRARDTWRLR